ncbi:MAG: glycosyltransferase family 39 protein [Candidatus Wallbacteria bacterium]|nr:glycosyltransferase family 39 protein [Candidatus Wallbacteria bacterium]
MKKKHLILLILVLGLALRLYRLSDFCLDWDEHYGLKINRECSALSLVSRVLQEDTHPPTYYLLERPFLKLPFSLETCLRLVSVFFGVAGIYYTFRLGSFMFGLNAGLFAALLCAFNPFHFYHSQEARMYSMLYWASAQFILYYLRFRENPGRKSLAVLVVSSLAGFYSDYYFIFVFAFAALHFLATLNQKAGLRSLFVWMLSVFAGLSPVLIFGSVSPLNSRYGTLLKSCAGWLPPTHFFEFIEIIRHFLEGYFYYYSWWAITLFLLIVLTTMLLRVYRGQNSGELFLLGYLLIPLLLLFFTSELFFHFSGVAVYRMRHGIIALPALLIFMARFFTLLPGMVRIPALGALLLIFFQSILGYQDNLDRSLFQIRDYLKGLGGTVFTSPFALSEVAGSYIAGSRSLAWPSYKGLSAGSIETLIDAQTGTGNVFLVFREIGQRLGESQPQDLIARDYLRKKYSLNPQAVFFSPQSPYQAITVYGNSQPCSTGEIYSLKLKNRLPMGYNLYSEDEPEAIQTIADDNGTASLTLSTGKCYHLDAWRRLHTWSENVHSQLFNPSLCLPPLLFLKRGEEVRNLNIPFYFRTPWILLLDLAWCFLLFSSILGLLQSDLRNYRELLLGWFSGIASEFRQKMESEHLNPPLFFTLVFAFTVLLFSEHSLGISATSAKTVGLLGIYCIYLLGKELFGVKTGLYSALFASLSPFLFCLNLQFPEASVTVFLTAFYLFLFLRFLRGGCSWELLACVSLAGFTFSQGGFLGIYLFSILFSVIHKKELNRDHFLKWQAAVLIFSSPSIIYFLSGLQKFRPKSFDLLCTQYWNQIPALHDFIYSFTNGFLFSVQFRYAAMLVGITLISGVFTAGRCGELRKFLSICSAILLSLTLLFMFHPFANGPAVNPEATEFGFLAPLILILFGYIAGKLPNPFAALFSLAIMLIFLQGDLDTLLKCDHSLSQLKQYLDKDLREGTNLLYSPSERSSQVAQRLMCRLIPLLEKKEMSMDLARERLNQKLIPGHENVLFIENSPEQVSSIGEREAEITRCLIRENNLVPAFAFNTPGSAPFSLVAFRQRTSTVSETESQLQLKFDCSTILEYYSEENWRNPQVQLWNYNFKVPLSTGTVNHFRMSRALDYCPFFYASWELPPVVSTGGGNLEFDLRLPLIFRKWWILMINAAWFVLLLIALGNCLPCRKLKIYLKPPVQLIYFYAAERAFTLISRLKIQAAELRSCLSAPGAVAAVCRHPLTIFTLYAAAILLVDINGACPEYPEISLSKALGLDYGSLRICSILASIAGGFLTYRLVKSVSGAGTARLSLMLLPLIPLYFLYAQQDLIRIINFDLSLIFWSAVLPLTLGKALLTAAAALLGLFEPDLLWMALISGGILYLLFIGKWERKPGLFQTAWISLFILYRLLILIESGIQVSWHSELVGQFQKLLGGFYFCGDETSVQIMWLLTLLLGYRMVPKAGRTMLYYLFITLFTADTLLAVPPFLALLCHPVSGVNAMARRIWLFSLVLIFLQQDINTLANKDRSYFQLKQCLKVDCEKPDKFLISPDRDLAAGREILTHKALALSQCRETWENGLQDRYHLIVRNLSHSGDKYFEQDNQKVSRFTEKYNLQPVRAFLSPNSAPGSLILYDKSSGREDGTAALELTFPDKLSLEIYKENEPSQRKILPFGRKYELSLTCGEIYNLELCRDFRHWPFDFSICSLPPLLILSPGNYQIEISPPFYFNLFYIMLLNLCWISALCCPAFLLVSQLAWKLQEKRAEGQAL